MKPFSPIGSIRPYLSGSSESGPSRSPTQAQQGESPPLPRLPHDTWVGIAMLLDRSSKARLRLVSQDFKAVVSEAVTHVEVRKREDLSKAIEAYKTGVTTLNLSHSDITDDDLALLKGLPRLKQLDLSGCKSLTDDGIAHLQHLTSLQQLDLSGCENITDGGVAHLQHLTSLQQLNLSGCENITDGGVAHLQHLTSLQQLDLSVCWRITDGGVAHLQYLTSLQQLDLSECDKITEGGVAHLQHLTSLQQLDLSECKKLTNDKVKHLREQLRNCLVIYC